MDTNEQANKKAGSVIDDPAFSVGNRIGINRFEAIH
jgi:hypothetical protein